MNHPDRLEGLSPQLTLEFFSTFARFEYALKRCSYLKTKTPGKPAEACRKALAAQLGTGFFEEVRSQGAIPTLFADPPRNLIVARHGGLGENESEQPTRTLGLLDSAWRVRNNLFHGNKTFPGNRQRDEELMREVLWLIRHILSCRDDLREEFHEGMYSS